MEDSMRDQMLYEVASKEKIDFTTFFHVSNVIPKGPLNTSLVG